MIPAIDLSTFSLGQVHIHVFGLLLVLGVIIGHMALVRRARAMQLGSPWLIEGFAIAIGAGAIVASFVASQILGLGLSSVFGLAGAIAAGATYVLAVRGDLLRFADAAAYVFPFGWLPARLGCAAVHDHLGPSSTSILAVRFPSGSRLDLGLLEAMGTLVLLAAVVALGRRGSARPGIITAVVAMCYAVIRFPLDFLRVEDLDLKLGSLTVAQWGCFTIFALGVAAIFAQGRPVSSQRT